MNWAEIFTLDGRGFYIWGSFGAFALAVIVEVVLVRMRGRRINAEIEEELMAAKLAQKTKVVR